MAGISAGGYFGCVDCEERGERTPSGDGYNTSFPASAEDSAPARTAARIDAQLAASAIAAADQSLSAEQKRVAIREASRGVQRLHQFRGLVGFDSSRSNPFDMLHFLLNAVPLLLKNWLSSMSRAQTTLFRQRLDSIKMPQFVGRTDLKLHRWKKWKGTI